MLITLLQNGEKVNQYRFRRGPIYIGRQLGSQIFLPDRTVSRQHAVVYNTDDNRWFLEDLDSPNKTILNDEPIHKSPINTGDVVKIGSFLMEFELSNISQREGSMHLDDTIAGDHDETQSIARRVDRDDSPVIRIYPKRLNDLQEVYGVLSVQKSKEDIIKDTTKLLTRQLAAANVLVALVDPISFDILFQYGQKVSTEKITIEEVFLKDKIVEAIKTGVSLLVPKMPMTAVGVKIKSGIIVPIVSKRKSVGVIYIDNSKEHEHYSMPELDYVILVSKLLAAKLQKTKDI